MMMEEIVAIVNDVTAIATTGTSTNYDLIQHDNSNQNSDQTKMNGFNFENQDSNQEMSQTRIFEQTKISSGTRVKLKSKSRSIDQQGASVHIFSLHSKEKTKNISQKSTRKNRKCLQSRNDDGQREKNNYVKRKGRPQKDHGSIASTSTNHKKTSNDATSNNVYYDPSKKQRDPFLLVDCHKFSDSSPFTVKIKLDALALMDLHAHCVHTEVIGCLGGFYCRVTRTLHVLVAEPCSSIDDHETKCEMDPVSQALALEKLERKNVQMVGWYHSHPTFLPNPSLRDIDTQNYYQNIFTNRLNNGNQEHRFKEQHMTTAKNANDNEQANDSDANSCSLHNGNGDTEFEDSEESRPFVAFIVSPFIVPPEETIRTSLTSKSFTRYEPIVDHPRDAKFYANNTVYNYHHGYKTSYCYFTHELNSVLASPIKCFWVGDSKLSQAQFPSKQRNLLIPYEIETSMIRDENFIPSITNALSEMCQWLFQGDCKSKSIVDLFKRYTRIGSINVTYLEKMIASLSHHLQNPSVLHLCTEYECERIRVECVSILMRELIENRQSRQLNKRIIK